MGQKYLPLKVSSRDVIYADYLLITQDTDWRAAPARYIGSELRVAQGATLYIGPGMHFFFATDAEMQIEGRLEAVGSFEEPIVFTSERQDGSYKYAPGQWKGVRFLPGTDGHQLVHVHINNAEVGLQLGMPEDPQDVDLSVDLTLGYAELSYLSEGAVLSYGGRTFIYNTLIYNAGAYLIEHQGGAHEYLHCTLSSYPRYFFHPAPVFRLREQSADPFDPAQTLSLQIRNSILWSSEELAQIDAPTQPPRVEISYSILRGEASAYSITGTENLWSDFYDYPQFANPEEYNYKCTPMSPARDAAKDFLDDRQYTEGKYYDIEGNIRDDKPDIGAYEWVSSTD